MGTIRSLNTHKCELCGYSTNYITQIVLVLIDDATYKELCERCAQKVAAKGWGTLVDTQIRNCVPNLKILDEFQWDIIQALWHNGKI